MGVAENMDTSNVETIHIQQACCFGKSLQFCLSLSYMANSTQCIWKVQNATESLFLLIHS